jgi:hypothetical protein
LWKIRAESYGTIRNDILGLCIADKSLEFMIIPESESSSGHSQEHCHSYIVFFRLRSLPGSMCSGDMNPGRAIHNIFWRRVWIQTLMWSACFLLFCTQFTGRLRYRNCHPLIAVPDMQTTLWQLHQDSQTWALRSRPT